MPACSPRHFLLTLLVLGGVHAVWLAAHWPGVLGNDTLAVLYEVTGRVAGFSAGKTSLWVNFVKWPFTQTGSLGWVTALQLLLMAVMASRMVSWTWAQHGLRWAALLALAFVLTPHMLRFSGTLYPDALFAMGTTAALFELWRCLKQRRVSAVSFLMLAIALPFALLGRTNGIVLLLPLAYTLWQLPGRRRVPLLLLALLCGVLAHVGSAQQTGKPQGALFPMVMFETVGFLQPHPFSVAFGLPAHNVSPATLAVLHRYADMPTLLQAHDADYWDSLVHTDASPRLMRMEAADQQVLQREFFRHNVWHNLPAFLASRLNVFLVSALAHGHFPTAAQTTYVLDNFEPGAQQHARLPQFKPLFEALDRFSWQWRGLLWSPLIGIALMLLTLRLAARTRQWDEGVLMLGMLIQLLGIGMASSAGEYRYLLAFFLLPLAATPMWLHLRQHQRRRAMV